MADPSFAVRTRLEKAAGGGWRVAAAMAGPTVLRRMEPEDWMRPDALLRIEDGQKVLDGRFGLCGTAFHAGEQCGFGVDCGPDGTFLLGDVVLEAGSAVGFSPRAEGAPGLVPGTLVETAQGERSVDGLAAGDGIRLADGTLRALRRVVRRQACLVFAEATRVEPVRIPAGALGPDLPRRELLVSPEQALLLGGVLVQAGALVGGRIGRVDSAAQPVSYLQLDVGTAALLAVAGLAVESARGGPGDEAVGGVGALPRARSARQVPYAVRALVAGCG